MNYLMMYALGAVATTIVYLLNTDDPKMRDEGDQDIAIGLGMIIGVFWPIFVPLWSFKRFIIAARGWLGRTHDAK